MILNSTPMVNICSVVPAVSCPISSFGLVEWAGRVSHLKCESFTLVWRLKCFCLDVSEWKYLQRSRFFFVFHATFVIFKSVLCRPISSFVLTGSGRGLTDDWQVSLVCFRHRLENNNGLNVGKQYIYVQCFSRQFSFWIKATLRNFYDKINTENPVFVIANQCK